MKKLILPLLLLVAIGMLAAVESDPSAVVGYFKKTLDDGGVQGIALPFDYADLSVNSVMTGTGYLDNDAMFNINTGFSCLYYAGFGWDGDLAVSPLEYGQGYYLARYPGNGALTYYLLGTVDPNPHSIEILGNGQVTGFGINQAAAVVLDDNLFGTAEVGDDAIYEVDLGLSATYYDGYGWDGDIVAGDNLQPTLAYYYQTATTNPGFIWNYTPPAPPSPSPRGTTTSNRNSK